MSLRAIVIGAALGYIAGSIVEMAVKPGYEIKQYLYPGHYQLIGSIGGAFINATTGVVK